MTAEEWTLVATVFLSGLGSGLLGMLSAIMRPMLAAMDDRDFRKFMEAFLRYAGHSWGKVYNYAWSAGMTIGPVVALVLLLGRTALLYDQLDPIGRDLGGVRLVPGSSGLHLGGPSARPQRDCDFNETGPGRVAGRRSHP
jgi:hypothetical protein